jgi:hypothetical protein
MATRGCIAIHNPDGSVTSIHAHFDNYLDGTGATLVNHYTDPVKVQALINLGAVSSLRSELGQKHQFDHCASNWCTFYGRDRGDPDSDAVTSPSVQQWLQHGQEYNYLFRDGEWWVECYHTDGELRSLVQLLLEQQ